MNVMYSFNVFQVYDMNEEEKGIAETNQRWNTQKQ